jgi:predicted phosphodiesterase
MSLEKILLIPDSHVPYHDKKAFKLIEKVAGVFKPNHLIIMGDFADMYAVSSHDKNPDRALKLDYELKETHKELKRLKDFGAKTNVFVAGNHEDRLERYLMKKAPELYDVVNIRKILKLDELGFKYIPYRSHYTVGKLNVTHDTGSAGRYAHYKALDAFQHNVVIGHTHRLGYAVEGAATGERHVTAMFGWLGDKDQVDYMHKVKIARDWSLGFGVGYLDKETNNVHLCPIPIVSSGDKYTCVVDGKLFRV